MREKKARLTKIEKFHVRIAVNAAALAFEVDERDIMGRDRHENLVMARMTAYWMLCRKSGITLNRIGKALDRDHGAIISGRKKIQGVVDTGCNDHKFLSKIAKAYELYREFLHKHNVEQTQITVKELEDALRVV